MSAMPSTRVSDYVALGPRIVRPLCEAMAPADAGPFIGRFTRRPVDGAIQPIQRSGSIGMLHWQDPGRRTSIRGLQPDPGFFSRVNEAKLQITRICQMIIASIHLEAVSCRFILPELLCNIVNFF